MSAFPIIERELRIRARRSSTIWLRVIVGLVAGLSALATLSWAQQMRVAQQPGKALFDTLNGLVFVFCLFEGVRQTADCLSQEKREGTIGLLFLTDLRGFDVVLGKLVAASVGSFYGLLAVFPIMGVSVLAGGVTVGEFWRTPLVLLNTLFLSLASGLWVSAHHREQNRALLTGFGLVAALTLLPLPLELLIGPPVPSLSPGVAMLLANDAPYSVSPGRFWLSLLTIHAVGWILVALSGWKLAEVWRKDPVVAVKARTGSSNNRSAQDPALPQAEDEKPLREKDPAAWIAQRQRPLRFFVWTGIKDPTIPGKNLRWACGPEKM